MKAHELSDPEDIKIDGLPEDWNVHHIEPSAWENYKFVVATEYSTGLVPYPSPGANPKLVLAERQKFPHCRPD